MLISTRQRLSLRVCTTPTVIVLYASRGQCRNLFAVAAHGVLLASNTPYRIQAVCFSSCHLCDRAACPDVECTPPVCARQRLSSKQAGRNQEFAPVLTHVHTRACRQYGVAMHVVSKPQKREHTQNDYCIVYFQNKGPRPGSKPTLMG